MSLSVIGLNLQPKRFNHVTVLSLVYHWFIKPYINRLHFHQFLHLVLQQAFYVQHNISTIHGYM